MAGSPVSTCLRQTLLRLDVGDTLDRTLQLIASPDTSSAQHIGLALQKNQAYVHMLLRSDFMKKRKGGSLSEEEGKDAARHEDEATRLSMLLGKDATRNAIVCLRLMRLTGLGLPKTDTDPVMFDAQKSLKRALTIEEFSFEKRLAHAASNYVGGLVHDWLAALAASNKDIPKSSGQYLEELWKPSFRCAQLAYHLGSALKTFKYQSYAFAAGLALPLGKYLMSTIFTQAPLWTDFIADNKKKEILEWSSHWRLLEQKTFPITHNEIASLLFSFFKPLREVEKSAFYYQEPYLIRTVHPDLFKLAVILSVAERLSYLGPDQRKVTKVPSVLLSPAQNKWLREIGIQSKSVEAAVALTEEPGR